MMGEKGKGVKATETPRVCLGCFRERQERDVICPHCGWKPGKEYDEVFGWTLGDVFEKRYLLGALYCRVLDMAVWRIYDRFLDIPCFVLRTAEKSKEPLHVLAERIKSLEYLAEISVKIMSVRMVDGNKTLFFSMGDSEGKEDALQAVLRAKSVSSEKKRAVWGNYDREQKMEQTLPKGTLLNDCYRILQCIGIGGFGMIYLCQDQALQRQVALKEYFPSEWAEREETYVSVKNSQLLEAYRFGLQSFYGEARLSAKFLHVPHIVDVYDVIEANDTAYLVMEYISGTSIGREMRARGYRPYGGKELAEIIFPVIAALKELHAESVIHSDISPGNIMRSEKGNIFLIDMGAAKYALHAKPTLSAAFLKPDYAAPEQYRTAGQGIPGEEGPWTDVYALGATIYYLLTGQKPPDVMQRLSGKNPDVALPKKCRLKHAKQWVKLLNHAMALEIQERIVSAEELGKEVRKLLE